MQVWRNCQVLSEQTSDFSAFRNAMSLKYVLICKEHFSYFDPDYPTPGLTVTGLSRVHRIYASMSYWYLILLAYYAAGRRSQLRVLCLRTAKLFAHSSISLPSSFSNCRKTDYSRFWLLWICVHEVRGIRAVSLVPRSGLPDWALELNQERIILPQWHGLLHWCYKWVYCEAKNNSVVSPRYRFNW
jgi:hypothetical protein